MLTQRQVSLESFEIHIICFCGFNHSCL
uniref:Uncharacterized protein n=1 Tax=Anguilla anguilla TaxID=7936 RepID=A0A0E9QBZ3_ANGAN